MIKKLLVLSIVVFNYLPTQAQNSNDTSNYPYWIDMMQDRNVNFFQTQRAFNLYWQNRTVQKGSGWKAFKRWEWINSHLVDSLGNFPNFEMQYQDYQDKIDQDNKSWDIATPGLGVGSIPCKTQGDWKPMGPTTLPVNNTGQMNGMGRVNAIGLHPTDSNTIYIGSAAGGIWKTTNSGVTWTVNTDSLPTLGVSAIAITKTNPNVMYFGSGDRDAGDAVGYGVFKSTNAGATWSISNSGMGNRTVGRLIIDPNNASVLLAACNGGIYRSTNAGASWTQTYSGGFFKDIIFKPDNSNVVYATNAGLLYRSLNNGQTWSAMTTGLPTTGVSRAVIEVSALDPKLVYVWIANGSVHKGIYLSRDSGNTFRTQSTTPNIHDYSTTGSGSGGQAWYDMDMVSDPTNAAILYCGGVNIFKSVDTGKTWSIAGYWVNQIHADQHELAADPISKRIYAGNDGGLYMSRNKGTPWIPLKSGLGIAQIYKMDASRTKKDILINGYQDNGTGNYNGGWYTTYGGDGMDCAVDQTDYRYSYGELYYGSIFRVFNVNAQTTIANNGYIASGSDTINESGGWVTPFTLREGSGNTMFIGYKNIWRSNNIKAGTVTWKKISSSLGGVNNVDFTELESNIANSDILYASRSNGTFFRSDNVNATTPSWNTITQPVSGTVNAIETDPKNQNVVYIGIGVRVYRSTNKGASWTQVNTNFSNNVATILMDTSNKKKGIYVGTYGGGVWYTDTTLSTWKYFSKGLPNTVSVTELKMYYEPTKSCNCNVLYGSTYNRGNWYTTIYNDGTKKPVALLENYDTVVCKANTVSFKDKSCFTPGRFKWSFAPSNISFVSGNDSASDITVSFGSSGKYVFTFMAENCNGIDTLKGVVNIGDSITRACTTTTTNSVSGLGIFNVELGTLNRSSSGRNPEGAYIDMGCTKVVKLKKGKKYTLKVLTGTTYTEQVKAFIDYNNNGSLSDAGELVYQPAANLLTHIDSFTIPTTVVTNKIIRLRVRSDYISIGTNPCSNLNYGQTEDYGIFIEDDITPKFVTDVTKKCQDLKVKFTDSTKGVGANYSWNFGAGAVPSTATGKGPHTVTYTSPGYKKVVLTVDSKIYSKDSAVEIYSAPNISVVFTKGDSSVCRFKPFTLSANDANASSPSYQWRLNGINIVDSTYQVYRKSSSAFSDSGVYSVVASTAQCKDTAFKKVYIRVLPLSNFYLNDSTQCLTGNSFTYTNSSSISKGTYRNQWYFGDNTSDTGYSKSKTYTNYGTYSVKLRSISNYGCIDSITRKAYVYENSVPNFSINSAAQCYKSNAFTFTNTTSLNTGSYTSSWKFGDASTSNLNAPNSKTYSVFNNSYKVKLYTTTNNGCIDSTEKTVTLYPNPVASFNVNDTDQCNRGNSFIFTNSSSILSGTYNSNWSFGDLSTATTTSTSHTYSNPGTYAVRLILSSNQSCNDTTYKNVYVFDQPKAKFTINDSTQCLKANALVFTNTSTIGKGTINPLWSLGNGVTSNSNTVNYSYPKDSNYVVKLLVISNNNCRDSIIKPVAIYPQSKLAFGINASAQCFKGNSYSFTNASSIKSGTVSYQWDFGDATSSTIANPPAKSYSTFKDSVYVTLMSNSNQSCKDTIIGKVYLYSSPIAAFSINDSSQCYKSNAFVFSNNSTSNSNVVNSSWNFGDANSSSANSPSHRYNSYGNYTVKLLVSSHPSCKDSISKSIIVLPSPIANFNVNDSTQCLNGNVFIYQNTTIINTGSYTSSWDFGNSQVSTQTNPANTFLSKGIFNVTLYVNSNNNCKDTFSRDMTVFESPKANFSPSSLTACFKNNVITFTNTTLATQAYTRSWYDNTKNISNANTSFQYSFSDSGYKQIKLVVVSDQLCSDSIIKTIFIAPQPIFNLNGQLRVCKNENLELDATPTTYNYKWDFGPGTTGNSSTFTTKCDFPGVFTVKLIASNAYNCIDTITKNVTVHDLPVPLITLSDKLTLTGDGVEVTAADATGIPVNSRSWLFSNGATGTNMSEILIFNDTVTLTAKLTIVDTNGCSGTSTVKKFFVIPNDYYLPNTFTPNGNSINDEFKLSGYVQVKNFSMKVFNRWGQMMFMSDDPNKGWDGTYEGNLVPNGNYIYLVEFEDMNGKLNEKKGFIMIMR